MSSIFTFAKEQYEWVCSSREVLLSYCQIISKDDFLKENGSFGRGGSIRNLLVHIANTYEFWIGKSALSKNIAFTDYSSQRNIEEVIKLFDSIDILVVQFLESLKTSEINQVHYEINGIIGSAKPLKIFTHVITHEFHHKGQILSLSRHWGYTPVDTDVLR